MGTRYPATGAVGTRPRRPSDQAAGPASKPREAALPAPDHPEHHLVFDADKLHFYSATCYAWLGMADPAEEHAGEVIRQCGDGRWKTRFANAHVDLGLARAARGEIDGAAEAGQRALAVFDAPPTATLWRVADLHAALSAYGGTWPRFGTGASGRRSRARRCSTGRRRGIGGCVSAVMIAPTAIAVDQS